MKSRTVSEALMRLLDRGVNAVVIKHDRDMGTVRFRADHLVEEIGTIVSSSQHVSRLAIEHSRNPDTPFIAALDELRITHEIAFGERDAG